MHTTFKKKIARAASLTALAATFFVAGCAMMPSDAELDKMAAEMVAKGFRDQGIATVARLNQDEANRECSAADVAGKPLSDARAKAIETANMATIKAPAGGNYIGDWREGERIAQSGRGMTWTDPANFVNGGNCYNCHQINKAEVSFGTLGPSLYQYGRLRGVADPASAAAKPIVEYTWGKLYNARAYNACSAMPRFGHAGVLTEVQMRHLMALLLDPASPVNAQ